MQCVSKWNLYGVNRKRKKVFEIVKKISNFWKRQVERTGRVFLFLTCRKDHRMSENEAIDESKKYKVIIIGGGLSGLSTAYHLTKNGLKDFCILEARDRIGGRISSMDIGTQKIELGANWIFGILGNPMFEWAMTHGLVNILNAPKPHKLIATTEDGRQVPFPILQEIYEAYVCFLKRCEEYFLCQYLPPPDIDSVGEHINYEIELYLSNQPDSDEKHLKKMIFECLMKRETCITGCNNMNEIDLLELGSYTELQGGNISLPGGYSSILDPMTQAIQPEQIVLSCPIKTIHWKRKTALHDRNGGTGTLETVEEVDSDDSDKTVTDIPVQSLTSDNRYSDNVKIVCDDGREYYANHVICTVPLGVLKDNKMLFEPQLPQYKLESIEHLLFGTVDKIFLEYDRPFLHADISEVMLLWDPIEESPNSSLEKSWFRKIYSFSKVSETLLLGWISGREAEYMETLSHNVVANICTDILRKFLKDPFIPKPRSCVCTNWHRQQFCRGSYTAIAVGGSQEDIENIAQPLYASPHQSKPAVLFAGEHTHSNFYSTVHGAYLSGRTAAQILLTADSPEEAVMESDTSDLSSWIQGIALE